MGRYSKLCCNHAMKNILKIKEPVGWNDQIPRTLVQPGYVKPEEDAKE